MAKLLKNPKLMVGLIVFGAVFLVSVAGGVLGNEFGGGFLSSPIAHIQLKAEPITAEPPFLGFEITNTMVGTWIAIVILVVISFLTTHRLREVPSGLQNFVEVIVEFFVNLCESVAGPQRGRRFLPLVMTIFLFIVTANWLGALPGFGTVGRIEPADEVKKHAIEQDEDANLAAIKLTVFDGGGAVGIVNFGSVDDQITAAEFDGDDEGKQTGLLVPYLRSANTEVNTTLAIALIAMVMVHAWALRSLGLFGHLGKFVNFKRGPIELFVGILEAVGEVARVISLTFRLFGNIFAGEVLLLAMAFLVPLIGIIPFLGLELFVGLIQAFIFAILVLIFSAIATISHEAESH